MYGHYELVEILNGLNEDKQPMWYQLGHFDDAKRAESRAKAQSKKNPTEIYRHRRTMGYSQVSKYDKYWIKGEMVAYCTKAYNDDWKGDARPAFPDMSPIKMWELIFDEVGRAVHYKPLTDMYSMAAVRAAYIGRGWSQNHKIIKAEDINGKVVNFAYGEEVISLQPHIDGFIANMNYKDTLIVPDSIRADDLKRRLVEFRLSHFQRPDLRSVVEDFNQLGEMVQNMSDLAVNNKEAMADIARVLQTAVEDIKKYASMEYQG